MATLPPVLVNKAPQTSSQLIPVENRFPSTLKIALISMPWGAVRTPTIALGILKNCIVKYGYEASLLYLNIPFARRIGLDLYEHFSSSAHLYPEWFFSYSLFGALGSREVDNAWDSISSSSLTDGLLKDLEALAFARGLQPHELCRRIAEVDVPAFIEECCKTRAWPDYDVVGFTTTFAQSQASLLLAKRIKELSPRTQIVFGGANVDAAMGVEYLRAFEWIDYVVHGDGEEALPSLLQAIETSTSVLGPGISGRHQGFLVDNHATAIPIHNLDNSPRPDYREYIDTLSRCGYSSLQDLTLFFESSRGCWWGAKHHCTFCGLNGSGMSYRSKSSHIVREDIVALARDYGCLNLAATDNILDLQYFKTLFPKLIEDDLDLRLFYEIKANITYEQMEMLAAAGVRVIQPGIESLNSRLLRLMGKGVTAMQNVQLLKWCSALSVTPQWNILYGFPGEYAADYEHLAELMLKLSHFFPPGTLTPIIFERFSPYHSNPEKYGLELKPEDAYKSLYPQSRVDLTKIAYYFENTRKQESSTEKYIARAKQAWGAWKDYSLDRTIYCRYRRGPGYLRIEDNRPRLVGEGPAGRVLTLKGVAAELYIQCDRTRTRQSLIEWMKSAGHDERLLQSTLDLFVAHGLMFQESDRYLSLAVRVE